MRGGWWARGSSEPFQLFKSPSVSSRGQGQLQDHCLSKHSPCYGLVSPDLIGRDPVVGYMQAMQVMADTPSLLALRVSSLDMLTAASNIQTCIGLCCALPCMFSISPCYGSSSRVQSGHEGDVRTPLDSGCQIGCQMN